MSYRDGGGCALTKTHETTQIKRDRLAYAVQASG